MTVPVFDGHNDTLVNLYLPERGKGRPFFTESDIGHIDLPRAVKGGLAGGIFAVFTPTPRSSPEADDTYGFELIPGGYRQKLRSPIDPQYARDFTDRVVDSLYDLEAASHGTVKMVRTFSELAGNIRDGILSVVLHFEGAEAIREDLSNLESYYEKGLRSLGLVWSRPNVFACGVHFEYPHSPDTGPGLTNYGERLVGECNRLGILVDLAHITEKGFWDVAKLLDAPLVVSHADAYALCPSTRNLTDEQIDAVGKTGGIIGVNFEPFNTSYDANIAGKPTVEEQAKRLLDAPLSQIVRHIDYIANRIGVDCVGFGSDFDGADMPRELNDIAGLPKLIEELRRAGYSNMDVEKIASGNWLRVIHDTWKA